MSRDDRIHRILELFSGFPKETQEAIATGFALGAMSAAKEPNKQPAS